MAQHMPFLPVIHGDTRFQPVHVGDVALAVMAALARDDTGGRVFELGGPKVWKFRELMAYILAETGRHRRLVEIPDRLARLQAAVLEHLPGKLLTTDQLLMLARDNVVSEGAADLTALGIHPTPIELVVPTYLARYRQGGGRRELEI